MNLLSIQKIAKKLQNSLNNQFSGIWALDLILVNHDDTKILVLKSENSDFYTKNSFLISEKYFRVTYFFNENEYEVKVYIDNDSEYSELLITNLLTKAALQILSTIHNEEISFTRLNNNNKKIAIISTNLDIAKLYIEILKLDTNEYIPLAPNIYVCGRAFSSIFFTSDFTLTAENKDWFIEEICSRIVK